MVLLKPLGLRKKAPAAVSAKNYYGKQGYSAAESAPAEYPCQVSDSSVVLLKPLGLSQETFDKQRNQ